MTTWGALLMTWLAACSSVENREPETDGPGSEGTELARGAESAAKTDGDSIGSGVRERRGASDIALAKLGMPRFDAWSVFPRRPLLALRSDDLDALERDLRDSLIGRVVFHPAWRDTLETVAAKHLRSSAAGLEISRQRAIEVFDACEGELAFAAYRLVEGAGTEWVLAVELDGIERQAAHLDELTLAAPIGGEVDAVDEEPGDETVDDEAAVLRAATAPGPDRQARLRALAQGRVLAESRVLSVLGEVRRSIELSEDTAAGDIEEREIGGRPALVWPAASGSAASVILDSHLVFASSPALLSDIIARHSAAPSTEASEAPTESSPRPDASDGHFMLRADLDAWLEAIVGNSASDRGELRRVARVFGLESVGSLRWTLGPADGSEARSDDSVESRVALEPVTGSDRFDGVLAALLRSFPDSSTDERVLERVPHAAREIVALRWAPGRLLVEVDQLLRREVPEIGDSLESLYALLEATTGVSMQSELQKLEPLTVQAFALDSPIQGGRSDWYVLADTAVVDRYWAVLHKFAEAAGGSERQIDRLETSIAHLALPHSKPGVGGAVWLEALVETLTRDETERLPLLALGIARDLIGRFSSLARMDLGDGQTLLAASPLSAQRYLDYHATRPMVSADKERSEHILRQLTGAGIGVWTSDARGVLSAYDRLVSWAQEAAPGLEALGIDVARLPPAEAFLAPLHPAGWRLVIRPDRLELSGQRVLESSTGWALVGGGAALYGSIGVARASFFGGTDKSATAVVPVGISDDDMARSE